MARVFIEQKDYSSMEYRQCHQSRALLSYACIQPRISTPKVPYDLVHAKVGPTKEKINLVDLDLLVIESFGIIPWSKRSIKVVVASPQKMHSKF